MKDTYPWPSRYFEGFADESEYRDWLREIFVKFGWRAQTEVRSEEQKRADLIVEHPKWGTYGIECKQGDRARKVAMAFEQILSYKNEVFPGFNIDAWCVAVSRNPTRLDSYPEPNKHADMWVVEQSKHRKVNYSEFLNVLGVGWLDQSGRLEMHFNNSNPMIKVPIARVEYPTGKLVSPSLDRLQNCDRPEIATYFD